MEQLDAFHFIRPGWLVLVIGVAVIWYMNRPKRPVEDHPESQIAPHLLKALLVGSAGKRRFFPIDGVALCLTLLTVAVAGPTWSRVPNPLIAETAPLVVALKVTETMETPDLAPTRLDRARFKILDLISARAGARTALVAYAGTAHRVSPLTEDPNILRPLLESLTPKVMPQSGDNATSALTLATQVLETAETDGAILFVLDDINPSDLAAFQQVTDPPLPPIVMLVSLPASTPAPQLDQITNATIVRLTPDDSDIQQIERRLRSAHRAALLKDERLAWDDRGWWLIWPAALFMLLSFRRGWTMRWAVVTLTVLSLQTPTTARADGWIDWFLTPDQQGRLAYEQKEFAKAGELFQDPMWQGYAKLRAGQYADAAEVFVRLESADAAFAEGLARIRNREYRPGARAFEKALIRQPAFPEAERNRDIAWAIVEYVESTREQSDTGEESGIGADDIVFDNEAQRGAETQIQAPQEDGAPLTAQQWIDSIDTNMGDFLRSRFLLENAEVSQ